MKKAKTNTAKKTTTRAKSTKKTTEKTLKGMAQFVDMMKTYKKNMEAFTNATKTTANVCKGLVRMQTQYSKNTWEHLSSHLKKTMTAEGSPAQKMQAHKNNLKTLGAQAIQHSKQVSSFVKENTTPVIQMWNSKVKDAAKTHQDNIKTLVKKAATTHSKWSTLKPSSFRTAGTSAKN